MAVSLPDPPFYILEVFMFTPVSLLTGSCYALETIPYHFIAYYPFRDRLRLPVWLIFCLAGGNIFVHFLVNCCLLSTGQSLREVEFLFAAISMGIYFSAVKAEPSKLLFIYILVMDYTMIVRGIAVFLDIRFFQDPAAPYQFLASNAGLILRMLLLMLTAPFAFMFLNETKNQVLKSDAPQIWNTIWLLPALNTFVVFLFTYNLNIETVGGLSFLMARVCLLIMILIVYYMLVSSLDTLRQQAEAAERARNQENLSALQRNQYSRLQKQIEETRQARHDLHQHLNLIQAYLEKGDSQALKDYIKKYGQKLPPTTWKSYCANYAADTIIRYYAEQAGESGILFESQIELPQELFVDEPDICILLGNLLENAVESCRLFTAGPPFIRIHAQIAGTHAISITVDNSCPFAPTEENKRFLSSKHPGLGTGTLSIRNIAAQYHGIADFKYEDGVFYASVFLNP